MKKYLQHRGLTSINAGMQLCTTWLDIYFYKMSIYRVKLWCIVWNEAWFYVTISVLIFLACILLLKIRIVYNKFLIQRDLWFFGETNIFSQFLSKKVSQNKSWNVLEMHSDSLYEHTNTNILWGAPNYSLTCSVTWSNHQKFCLPPECPKLGPCSIFWMQYRCTCTPFTAIQLHYYYWTHYTEIIHDDRLHNYPSNGVFCFTVSIWLTKILQISKCITVAQWEI